MILKRFGRALALGVIALSAAAAGAVSLAAAHPSSNPLAKEASDSGHSLVNCIRFDSDDPLVCGVLRAGPQGKNGKRGPRGLRGYRGHTGAVGPIGPVGATGATGVTGDQGITGPVGATGPQGAPGPSEVEIGTAKTYTYTSGSGSPIGHIIGPSVAACPVTGSNQEAYGGGATLTPGDNNQTSDVVTTQQSFPGKLANGGASVIPSAAGDTANAYEATAQVSSLALNDSYTVTAYVICGP